MEVPKDIQMEILSWVPAKSLLSGFKLVCKAWRNLIHDPGFVKMHLRRRRLSSKSLIQKQLGTVLYQLHPPLNCDDHLPLDLEHISPSSAGATKLDFDFDFEKLSYDFDFDFEFDIDFLDDRVSRLVGSCNGLLCLSINYDDNIFLLNPSTRKYKVSPKQLIHWPIQSTSDDSVTFGFGGGSIDDDDDEYKVVRIVNFYPLNSSDADDPSSPPFQQIDLYSMSSNSWTRWRGGDIPFQNINDRQFGLFLNGSVHWIAMQLPAALYVIVSFNIREEKFGLVVPIPPAVAAAAAAIVVLNGGHSCCPYIPNCISLMNVRGCLGNVYYKVDTQMIDIDLEIWVMKEYGIKESWTKDFVIRTSDSEPPRGLSGFSSIRGLRRSLPTRSMTCSLAAGDQIIIEARLSFSPEFPARNNYKLRRYGRRVLYDINKKKIDGDVIMEVNDLYHVHYQFDYIETLVSLKSSLHLLPPPPPRKRKNCSS